MKLVHVLRLVTRVGHDPLDMTYGFSIKDYFNADFPIPKR